MKKILLFLLIPLISFAQIKVKDLPTTTTGASGDFLIKDDAAGIAGSTKKISAGNFLSTYSVSTGFGTTNYIPKFNSSNSFGNSVMFQNSSQIGVGTTVPNTILDVFGALTLGDSTMSAIYLHNSGSGNILTLHPYSGAFNSLSISLGATNQNTSFTTSAGILGGFQFNASLILTGNPSQILVNNGGNGLGLSGDNSFSPHIFINNSGNVGIGTGSPSAKMEVVSTGTVTTYAMKINNSLPAEIAYFKDDKSITFGSNFSWVPTTGLLNLKHIGLGANSSVVTTAMLNAIETYTAVTGAVRGALIQPTLSNSTGVSSLTGLSIISTNSSTSGATTPGSVGLQINTSVNGTANYTAGSPTGINVTLLSGASQSGTIAEARGINIVSPQWSGSKPTTTNGLVINNLGISGTTTNNAILIQSQTGSTNNYGLVSAGSGTFSGVGTTAPTALWHINGASGFRYVDGGQALGKVLTSDANGVASWQTAGTGTVSVSLTGVGTITVTGTSPTYTIASTADDAWTAVPFNAGDFTAASGDWNVDAGDVSCFRYKIIGKTMIIALAVVNTENTFPDNLVNLKIPASKSGTYTPSAIGYFIDATTRVPITVTPSGTLLNISPLDVGGTFTVGITNSYSFILTFEID